jgi:TatA/E family protein of Tat protein translocase
MFGSIGFPELMLIFGVALILFGPKRLPEIGRTLGKALGEFRKATSDLKQTLEEEVRMEEHRRLFSETREAVNAAVVPTTAVPTNSSPNEIPPSPEPSATLL